MRIVNNPAIAEDLLQETFLRFLQKAESARPEAHRAFLFQISHNLAVDNLKKYARVNNYDTLHDRPDQRDHVAETDYRILRENAITKMLASNPVYVEIFLLRLDFGMTYDEIGIALKIPKRTLMRYVDNLKKILREVL